MTIAEPIVRIAARGDGVTESGRHVAGGVPGDCVRDDGSLKRGPHHVAPPCRHFAKCGGCQLQHADEETLAQFVTDRVVLAAEGQGIVPQNVAPAHLSPPGARRRATLHATRRGKTILLGYREGRSHTIIDLKECPVLQPTLFALVDPLRKLLAGWEGRVAVDIELTQVDQGVACGIKGIRAENLQQTEALLDFARENALARLTVDDGLGPETVWEPEPSTVSLGGVPVVFPPGAFLQATEDGQATLVAAASEWLAGHSPVADLFAGLGTFALSLAGPEKVLAAEASRGAHLACRQAARLSGKPVFAQHRDLFHNPYSAEEISKLAAVLLDPPRAGAREQVEQIAQSSVGRVVYISCNPASWAKDAKRLVDAGFELKEVRPVGQFRWSTHVELASLFVRPSGA
ncbi:class I SAM-dependent RNA methyltransferase [Erythrobacter litoralis]|uniref:Putative RNA methyltransferase n=1 Tax=Erythrobacter litoralis (strain HTCC2594) TaxID=314225 RepID=Q2NA20_ERYLH|nr:class I SAM-dependent RNA methyltransferase [Erythrobacter litoralis]ABC63471.1 putative RNA methyltransferase [Erythrobacter litoralis HTCC2594]